MGTSPTIISEIVRAFPEAVEKKTHKGTTPLKMLRALTGLSEERLMLLESALLQTGPFDPKNDTTSSNVNMVVNSS